MSGERILIVEDDAAVAEMLAFALERAGMRPRCAADAREAEAALAEEGLPDLVLMDWMLPGTSGIALTRRWKEAPHVHVHGALLHRHPAPAAAPRPPAPCGWIRPAAAPRRPPARRSGWGGASSTCSPFW